MDRAFFLERLYPLQDAVLGRLTPLETGFYLTGGTAASRGYLQHRFSDDLDLFVNDDERFGTWAQRVIETLTDADGWHVDVERRGARFVRITVRAEVALKIEMVNDVPAHVGTLRMHPVLGQLDSAENILANKITALVDRREPKDLADIWGFCCRMNLSCETALRDAHSKAAGLFPPDIARVLLTATVDHWRLVQWDNAPEPQRFLADLREIGERLLLVR
ncbi:MAG: nucleotidyl transferase AbiEii/AbiGii toxin family protein [Candidatus Rokubacteria bacterium]|nr:nucleotidyl transferase AbiEii/AbiGii toxin family protein [Candidatus Rokubacteria bacterium]